MIQTLKDLIHCLRQVPIRRTDEYASAPQFDYIVGNLTGGVLTWLAMRAIKRGDWHEANHILAALKTGNSSHEEDPCLLGEQGQERPAKGQHVLVGFEI